MANLPHLRLYRVGTATALVVAPLLFLIDRAPAPAGMAPSRAAAKASNFIAGAAVFVAAGVAVAMPLLRMDDRDFATGGGTATQASP